MKKRALLVGTTVLAASAAMLVKPVAHNIMSNGLQYSSDVSVFDVARAATHRGAYTGVASDATCDPKMDLNAIYLGLQSNPLPVARERPQSATIPADATVWDASCLLRFPVGGQNIRTIGEQTLEQILSLEEGTIIALPHEKSEYGDYYDHYGSGIIDVRTRGKYGLGEFTASVGRNSHGKYLSFYDVWDFSRAKGGTYDNPDRMVDRLASTLLPKIGKPVFLYKRWYLNEIGLDDATIRAELKRRQVNP